MKTKVDCIEEPCLLGEEMITGYRPRIYSQSLECMVEIKGEKALQRTVLAAIAFGKKWGEV